MWFLCIWPLFWLFSSEVDEEGEDDEDDWEEGAEDIIDHRKGVDSGPTHREMEGKMRLDEMLRRVHWYHFGNELQSSMKNWRYVTTWDDRYAVTHSLEMESFDG